LPGDTSYDSAAHTLTGRRRRAHEGAAAARLRLALPAVALVLMLAVIFWQQPRVMSYFGLTLLLNYSLPLVFAAAAQMCIIAASDIDLGIGPFLSLVNCIAATLLGARPVVGVGALLLCVAAYVVMGALIHLRSLPSIVVTLGASFVWLGLALLLLPTPGGTVPAWLTDATSWRPDFVPLPILVGIVVAALGQFLFMGTSYGAVLRGVGGNPRAIERAGWSLLAARMTLYGAAGVLGVLGGLALAGLNTSGDATVGGQYTLTSIAAVIVGGAEFFGGIVVPLGAVVGAWIMLLTGSLLAFVNVSSGWQLSAQGGILILVLGLRRLARGRG